MKTMSSLHRARRATQIGFILLIFLIPVFDILRYDSFTKELFLFGKVWSLGLKTVWHQIITGHLSFGVRAGIIGVTIYMFIISVLARHTFCKYVCAAGLMQMLFGWVSPRPLRITFDRENVSKCTDCKGCEKVCFMNVKPRLPRKDIDCVNCGECIIACQKELGAENALFNFQRGADREKTRDRDMITDVCGPGAVYTVKDRRIYHGCYDTGFKETDHV